jgi:hypothetical protein
MKAIIIDIALDLSLLRRSQGVELSETYFIQGLGIAVSSPTLLLHATILLGSPDEMMQAAGVDDRSYSVRHGGLEHSGFASPPSAYSRIASSSFTRDFTVKHGRCQC